MSHSCLVKILLDRRNARKSEPKAGLLLSDPEGVVFVFTTDVTNSRLQPLLEPGCVTATLGIKKEKRMKINVVTLPVGNCFYRVFKLLYNTNNADVLQRKIKLKVHGSMTFLKPLN